jgi:hydrogenase-4 component F
VLLAFAAVAITGSPPFGMFFSEMAILRAGFSGSHTTAMSIVLGALVVLFCGFTYQIGQLVLGPRRSVTERRVPVPERLDFAMVTTIVAALAAAISAFYLPEPLLLLIHAATQVVWASA